MDEQDRQDFERGEGGGIATSLDKLGMILRQAQDKRNIFAMAGGGGFHPHPRIKYGAGSNPLPSRERGF